MKTIIFLSDYQRHMQSIAIVRKLASKYNILLVMNEIHYERLYCEDKLLNDVNNVNYLQFKAYNPIIKYLRKIFFKPNSILHNFMLKSKFTSLGQLFYEYLLRYEFYKNYKLAEKTICKNQVHAMVIIMDRQWDNVGFIKKAKENHIPIVQFFYHNPIASMAICRNNPKYMLKAKVSLYQTYIFTKFSSKDFGSQMQNDHFFYTAFLTNALYKFGVLSKNPWVGGTGLSDYIFIDNGVTYHQMQKYVTKEKLFVVGNLEYDVLFTNMKKKVNIKEAIYTKYNFNPTNKTCIISCIPLGEHSIVSMEEGYKAFELLLDTITKNFNYTLLLSLHPKMLVNLNNYQIIASKYNAIIIKEKLVDFIVIADLYIATNASTTLVFGALCNIKSIGIDMWGFNTNILGDDLTSIKSAYTYEQLTNIIKNIDDIEVDIDNDSTLLFKDIIHNGSAYNQISFFDKLINTEFTNFPN
jgi:hypothetical protein